MLIGPFFKGDWVLTMPTPTEPQYHFDQSAIESFLMNQGKPIGKTSYIVQLWAI
jgi:hypothetical protein